MIIIGIVNSQCSGFVFQYEIWKLLWKWFYFFGQYVATCNCRLSFYFSKFHCNVLQAEVNESRTRWKRGWSPEEGPGEEAEMAVSGSTDSQTRPTQVSLKHSDSMSSVFRWQQIFPLAKTISSIMAKAKLFLAQGKSIYR